MPKTTVDDDPQDLVSLTDAAEMLGVHYMTAYRYVRTGRLAATRHGTEWRVRRSDIDALRSAPAPAAVGRRRRADHRARLEERLVAGDEGGAWAVVEAALTSSLDPPELYHEVLLPAMRSIGDRWAAGELTVADEHQASVIVARIVGRLGPRFTHPGRRRGTIVLGSAPGDQHGLPTAFLADLLRDRNFRVIDLGANTPLESFVEAVVEHPEVVAVGVCVTSPEIAPAAAEVATALHRASDVPVVVGGSAIESAEAAAALGSDGFAADSHEVVDLFVALAAR